MKERLVSIITDVATELNQELKNLIRVELGEDAPLYGREGSLDSLGLVNLVIAVEQAIEDELGVTVTLADEKALSQKSSPFRTIGSLAQYAESLIPGRI